MTPRPSAVRRAAVIVFVSAAITVGGPALANASPITSYSDSLADTITGFGDGFDGRDVDSIRSISQKTPSAVSSFDFRTLQDATNSYRQASELASTTTKAYFDTVSEIIRRIG